MDNCYRFSHWIILALLGCDEVQQPKPVEPVPVYDVASLPGAAQPYASLMENNDNPSRDMAQMWTESRGDPNALSPLGGQGLFQFTPDTVDTAERSFCRHLGRGDPFNPYWAEACFEAMMEWQDIEPFNTYCDNRMVDECRYNGGFWCVWELRAAPEMTFRSAYEICGVETLPNGRMRSKQSCLENYAYSGHIDNFQPLFADMGGVMCD